MKKKILVLAKAEPLKSTKYDAVVCTAGITEDGEFIRIYPVHYRLFCDEKTNIKKYDWIEADCEKAKDDKRIESHKINPDLIKKVGHIETDGNWAIRNRILLPKLSKNIKELDESGASIGLIRPSEVLDFIYRKSDDAKADEAGREYNKAYQMIFDNECGLKKIPEIGKKLDRHFSYIFRCDGEDTKHNIICEDWELYQSFRSWEYDTEKELLEKIRQKFFDDFTTNHDLCFIMGTHFIYKTWIIIGLYYPPKNSTTQRYLDLS